MSIELKEGEVECDNCNGNGATKRKVECGHCRGTGKVEASIWCRKCQGEGKMDWVEFILGGKKPKPADDFNSIDDDIPF